MAVGGDDVIDALVVPFLTRARFARFREPGGTCNHSRDKDAHAVHTYAKLDLEK